MYAAASKAGVRKTLSGCKISKLQLFRILWDTWLGRTYTCCIYINVQLNRFNAHIVMKITYLAKTWLNFDFSFVLARNHVRKCTEMFKYKQQVVTYIKSFVLRLTIHFTTARTDYYLLYNILYQCSIYYKIRWLTSGVGRYRHIYSYK